MGIQEFSECGQIGSGDLRVGCQAVYPAGHFPVLIEQLRDQRRGLCTGTAGSRKHVLLLDGEVLLQMPCEKTGQQAGLRHWLRRPVRIRARGAAHQALRQDQALVMLASNGNQSGMSTGHRIKHID